MSKLQSALTGLCSGEPIFGGGVKTFGIGSGFSKITTSASLKSAVKDQACGNVTSSNRNLSKAHPGTPVPFALCYLCFLLFKFSLLPSVAPSKTKPVDRCTPKREFGERPSRKPGPVCPLLPLLPSVQNFLCFLLWRRLKRELVASFTLATWLILP
jgi:hypothetical protein